MPAERQEIGIPRLHVGRQVRHALRGVDQNQRSDHMGLLDDLSNRVHRAERVRNRHDRNQLRSFGKQFVERPHVEPATVCPFVRNQRDMPQHGPRALTNLLPRHEIRVMLHHRRKDFVARLEVRFPPTASHQIDCRRRALRKNHLVRMLSVD